MNKIEKLSDVFQLAIKLPFPRPMFQPMDDEPEKIIKGWDTPTRIVSASHDRFFPGTHDPTGWIGIPSGPGRCVYATQDDAFIAMCHRDLDTLMRRLQFEFEQMPEAAREAKMGDMP